MELDIPLISLPQALFCSLISLTSFFACVYVYSQIFNKEMKYKIVWPFALVNFFITLNFIAEFLGFFTFAFTTRYLIDLSNLYMLSMYGFIAAFFWFSTSLNGKKNIPSLIISITFFIFFVNLHIKGLLIEGFKYNGFTLIRVPGKFYSLFELSSVALCIIVFIVLLRYSKQSDAETRSRAIITLFASAPILFILFVTLALMRFTENYSTALFAPIFFTWMNIVLLFATGRAVVDLSFSREHIRAYSLLFQSASIKDASIVERMKLVEEAWYLITGASSQGDIEKMAKKLDAEPKDLYKKLGQLQQQNNPPHRKL